MEKSCRIPGYGITCIANTEVEVQLVYAIITPSPIESVSNGDKGGGKSAGTPSASKDNLYGTCELDEK